MSEDLSESLSPERKLVLEADLSNLADDVLAIAKEIKDEPQNIPRTWRIVLEGITLPFADAQSIVAQYKDSNGRTYNINFRKDGE